MAFSLGIFFMQIVDILMQLLESYKDDPKKILNLLSKIRK